MNPTPYLLPAITYKTDMQNSNPFDASVKENLFFYDGGFSCLVNKRNELIPFHEQSEAYVVFELERLELAQNGKTIKHFIHPKDYKSSNRCEQFVLLSNEENMYSFTSNDRMISITSHEVCVEGKSLGGLGSILWNDYSACRVYSQKFSQESGKTILVSQILSVTDRH
jgi:hypothetical protein